MELQSTGPSRWYYALAVFVLFAGFGLFGLTLWKGLSGATKKLQQVTAPGQSEVTLREPGDYTVFYESSSVMGNRVYSTGAAVPGLECGLASKSSGERIKLRNSVVDTHYDFEGRSGKSVLDFHIDQPGVYIFSSNYPPGREGEEVVLAIGKGITGDIFKTVFGGMAILFGSIAGSILIGVITAVMRYRARHRPQTAGGAPPPIE